MSKQKTPRTDAAYTKGRKEHGDNIDGRFLDMDAHARELETDLAEAVAALKECAEYTQDLREAWRRGAISSNDGGSARRSNMNAELNTKLNAFLAKHK